jgi:hypothetical protein
MLRLIARVAVVVIGVSLMLAVFVMTAMSLWR